MSDVPPGPQRFPGESNIGRPVGGFDVGPNVPRPERTGTPEVVRSRRGVMLVVVVVAAVVFVGALLMLRSDPGSVVDWENYEAGLHEQIEDAAARGDCATLDAVRAEAELTDADQLVRTGDGNEDLIRYLDSVLSDTECT